MTVGAPAPTLPARINCRLRRSEAVPGCGLYDPGALINVNAKTVLKHLITGSKAMDLAMDRLLTAAAAVCALAISGPALAQTRTGGNIASQLNQQELSHLSTETAPQGYAPQGYAPQGYAPQGYAPQGYAQQGATPPAGLSAAGLSAAGLSAAGLSAAGLSAAGLPASGLCGAGLRNAGLRNAGLPERCGLCRVPEPDRCVLSRLRLRLSGVFVPGLPLLLCALSLLL